MKRQTPRYWRSRGVIACALWPLSMLFRCLVAIRRQCYRAGWLPSWRSPVPVLVVGNITVGGAGKTPLVIALVNSLVARGLKVSIAMRSYGGASNQQARLVTAADDPHLTGDEALMVSRRTGVPVAVASKRTRAVQLLTTETDTQLVVCDDGMQHYALQRDIEIAVVDADYGLGNEFFLPAGPLRESSSRLQTADLIVYSGDNRPAPGYQLKVARVVNVAEPGTVKCLADFNATTVHAVAAIARPQKFFNTLRSHGIQLIEHAFPDHYRFESGDLDFADNLPVLMTEKDKVKCESWASQKVWYVEVSAILDDVIVRQINLLVDSAQCHSKVAVG